MHISRRSTRLIQALIPIPIAVGLAALLLLAGCGAPATAADTQALAASATVRIHAAGPVFLRGDHGGLSWSRGVALPGALRFLLGPRAALP